MHRISSFLDYENVNNLPKLKAGKSFTVSQEKNRCYQWHALMDYKMPSSSPLWYQTPTFIGSLLLPLIYRLPELKALSSSNVTSCSTPEHPQQCYRISCAIKDREWLIRCQNHLRFSTTLEGTYGTTANANANAISGLFVSGSSYAIFQGRT